MLMDKVMPRKLRGFTLTEAAIVLGIVGLILGAIWVAAAAVYNNLRVSTASGQLLQIAQNIRSIHATQQTIDSTISGHDDGAVPMAKAGAIPREMVDDLTAASPQVRNVWNGQVEITATSIGGVANIGFIVVFDDVPRSACVDLLVRTTGANRDSGLYQAGTATGSSVSALAVTDGVTANTFPVTITNAVTDCDDPDDMNDVFFTFTLRT